MTEEAEHSEESPAPDQYQKLNEFCEWQKGVGGYSIVEAVDRFYQKEASENAEQTD